MVLYCCYLVRNGAQPYIRIYGYNSISSLHNCGFFIYLVGICGTYYQPTLESVGILRGTTVHNGLYIS